MIKVKNLVKNYQLGEVEIKVLRGLDLDIAKGEFVAVTGLSGAGKSTLLYQMGLLDAPTSGEIIINNINTAELSEKQRSNFRLDFLGYVFQDYALMPDLTALENVAIVMLMLGFSKKESYSKAASALGKVGLKDRLDNLPSQLSGGQQQRVSIARAIVNKPKILFADEPTANLDTTTAKPVMETFKKLNSEGQTIVMVTHEDIYAKQSKRIIDLSDGKIKSDRKIK